MLPTRSMNNWLKEEMDGFRSYLRWMCVDRWIWWLRVPVFLLFGQLVPLFSSFYITCNSCDAELSRLSNAFIEISLTVLASLSYSYISGLLVKCELLLLGNLVDDTHLYRRKCVQDIKNSLKIKLPCYVLLFFVAKCAYKIWWYARGASVHPFLGNMIILSNIVACSLELASWLYRTTMFFFACIVFSRVHNFQKLQVNEFNKYFLMENSDLSCMLKEYLRIFQDMSSINNCFSSFFGVSLPLITLFQVTGALVANTLQSEHASTMFIQVDLALWSVTIVAGLRIMLHSAIEMSIVMKGITSAASRWHATQTFDIANGSMSFQERKTLVKCLSQNPCGIVIVGVKLEEFWLRLINWTASALTHYVLATIFYKLLAPS